MKALPARSVDCFICDLPYGQLSINGKPKVSETKSLEYGKGRIQAAGCPWDVKLDLAALWKEIKRLCKDDHTPVLMFCNTKFGYELIKSNEEWFRYDLVWNKERGVSFLMANKMPMKSHEMIYVFSKKGAYYKKIEIETDKKSCTIIRKSDKLENKQYGVKRIDGVFELKDGKRCPLSVINVKGSIAKNGHPTEKPLKLYKWLLERYCPSGGTILDPTAGSYNAVYAGAELGLHAIGIEKDIEFFNKAIKKTMENTKKKEIVKETMESINPTNEIIM
jgi:site-specific DNA-methyltransferase (adenine-specific)